MTKLVCQCGKGFASPKDGMCSKCREKQYAPTRRLLRQYGINRGDGLSYDNFKEKQR